MACLDVIDLCADYGAVRVLDGVCLSVRSGDVISLIGPSGSGKSSLLRAIVGLLPPVSGQVRLDGAVVDYADPRSLRGLRDRLAIVFQSFNLFQNMTALDNVTIGPVRVKGLDPARAREEGLAQLDRVGLADKAGRYPDELSGGQQQRVAIARALMLRPALLLLDEVTSALDPELVGEVLETVQGLAREGMTMLIVSHEMGFVREVSGTTVMMEAGKVVEAGPTARMFARPEAQRTRDFLARSLPR